MKFFFPLLYFILTSTTAIAQLIDKVPIELVDNLIFIEVKVNNERKLLHFLFDTGAGITVIDSKIADNLNLLISGELKIGTSGKSLLSDVVENNKLRIGDKMELDSIPLIIMDLSHISKYLKFNVDGIIGYDLLANTITETNIDELEMRFFSDTKHLTPENSQPFAITGLEFNHIGLPLSIVPKGRKDSIPLVIKIDTGAANYLTFHNSAVTKHQLIKTNKTYKIKKGFGADSTVTENISAKVSSATFGNKTWKNIPVVYEVDALNKSSIRDADGLIGQKMLIDFNITYHLKKGFVYLEKRK